MQNQSFPLVTLIIEIVVITLIFAYPLYVMAQKTNQENTWFAFVPILQAILLLQIAGKELWWFILFLIPCVNIVVGVIVWMAVAERMSKPSWMGILMIVPVVNIFVPYYLALG